MPRNYTPLPWKKTFRKVPPAIARTLAETTAEAFVVSCEKRLAEADMAAGIYRHLCISGTADLPTAARVILPSPNVGPSSFANVTPAEVAVKELGTVPKRIHGYAPSWKGSGLHRTTYVRQVWFTRLVVPPMTPLAMETVAEPAGRPPADRDHGAAPEREGDVSALQSPAASVCLRFRVGEVLRRTDPDFGPKLLRCLNLLQENVGAIGLIPVDADEAAAVAAAAEDIGWEVLPAITSDPAEGEILRLIGLREPARAPAARARLELLRDLNPRRVWHSTRGYVGYFLAEFADELTVIENLEADDALYLVRRPAAELSTLTRSELRAQLGEGAEWIARTPGWEARLSERVLAALGQAPDGQRLLL